MAGTYSLTVSKNGCSQYDQVKIKVGCAALNNVNAYSNSPNCEVKTGETLHLWVDKEGANYTYNWTGPVNFASTWRATGKTFVTDNYSGTYTVKVGYVGCTETVTKQVNVCIFKCDLDYVVQPVVGSCNNGNGSFKVTTSNNTAGRTISYRIEIRKIDAQGNYYYDFVPNYPTWVSTSLNNYTFTNVASGVYRVWVKEQNTSEQGGQGRVCEATAKIVELKCDPCSYVKIDAVPSDKLVPAAVISPIVLTANIYNEVGAPITVSGLSAYNWSGPNGITGNTNTVTTRIPGNYILIMTLLKCELIFKLLVIE
jgi:hypothetical protein